MKKRKGWGQATAPILIMAQIYFPEWDFSCEQFAVTDNNTSWLVWLKTTNFDRHYFKKNNLVCILGLAINFQLSRWSQPFAIICQGINSTKTEQDRKDATWLMWDNVGTTTLGNDSNSWLYIPLSEYPQMQFYINRGKGGLNGTFLNRVIREPLITVDFDGNDWTEEILRDVLRRINFAPGIPTPGVDPYTPGGTTDTNIPTGDFDGTSNPIDIPPLPTLSAVDARFITLYSPNLTQLRSLASYMWGSLFDIDQLKKLFVDPMDAILGITIVPVIPDLESSSSTIYVGNLATDTSAKKVTNQYKTVDCGSININEYWGSYLDYDPYTRLELYLPYIGTQTVAVDDVMGKEVHVLYHIDLLSGACVAFVKSGDSVLYTFTGQCATQIPITGNDWSNTINGVLAFAASAVKTGVAIAGQDPVSSVTGAISTASTVTQMKPRIQRSGSIGGSAGLMSIQKPYFILTRPRQALPVGQNMFTGYPSFVTSKLENLTGMTYIYEIHLEGISCTTEEQDEIENLLKSGVIL